ncbi:hypothetical protein [Burkholderia multivorans]|uniref:thiolase family protein n=1 Tax=Burkholderia multivorans TaxID=87883 RepID=UPI003C12B768
MTARRPRLKFLALFGDEKLSNVRGDVVIVGAARTAIDSFGGSLRDCPACDLATPVVKEAFNGAGVGPEVC